MTDRKRATLEWADAGRAGCLRVGGPDFDHKKQDPYDRACTVFRLGKKAIIKGWVGTPTALHWRAVCECLAREGFETMVFERAVEERRHGAEVSLLRYR